MSGKTKKVAILATDGFEQVELTKPRHALEESGAETTLVSLESGVIRGFNHAEPADTFPVDDTVDNVKSESFDALLIPGGVINPDALRGSEKAIEFVRSFFKEGKPVFAICHGPQVLITAGVVEGRRMTSFNTIRVDLENAGAKWVDESVVCDQGLVTSRNPDDIPDFNDKIVEELREGVHAGQHA
jgi:protease I